MRLDRIIDEIKNAVNANPFFENEGVRIISAYPAEKKPTRLKESVVAIGFDCASLSSGSIDENRRTGEIAVFADIFIPFKKDVATAQKILCELCRSLNGYNVIAISAGRIKADTITEAYVLSTKISLGSSVEFGGVGNE